MSSSSPPLASLLSDILSQLKLDAPSGFAAKILQYLELLDRWNRAYNLTAILDPHDRMVKHIADSLAVAPYLHPSVSSCWLDVGSGAGLPGIPLALFFPQQQWILLDKNAKKTRFLVQVKALLELENVTVVQGSVESFTPAVQLEGVICRAWTQLPEMIAKTQHLLGQGASLWAMKGACPHEELSHIAVPYSVYPIQVPYLQEERHLIQLDLSSDHLHQEKTRA